MLLNAGDVLRSKRENKCSKQLHTFKYNVKQLLNSNVIGYD